jgi:hypothetical protein
MSKYMEWINEQIAHHEREIAGLVIARRVLEAADLATSLKQTAKPPKPKGNMTTRRYVLSALRTGARTANQITNVVITSHPEVAPRSVTNSIYNARRVGAIVRDADGLYSLPKVKGVKPSWAEPPVGLAEKVNAAES